MRHCVTEIIIRYTVEMMHFRDTYTIPNNDPLMGPFDYVVYNVVYTLYYYVTLQSLMVMTDQSLKGTSLLIIYIVNRYYGQALAVKYDKKVFEKT